MKKAALLFPLFAVLIIMPGQVSAAEGGAGWLPAWAGQLGLAIEKVPAPQDTFVELKAKVQAGEKLAQFFPGVVAGDELVILHNGNVDWTVPVEGVPVKPCLVRMTHLKSSKTVNLIPDRRTAALRLAPPPFKGSNLQ